MSDDQEKIKGRKGKKAPNNRSEGETDTKSSVSESGHASSKQDEPQEISTSNGEDDSQGSPASNEEDDPEGSPASNEEDDPEGSSASDGEDGSEESSASDGEDGSKEIKFECEDCKTDFSIYKDREHRKIAQDGGENVLLGDVGKFCGAFYHVDGRESSFCLDANTCAIGERKKHQATPLTAVALVKYEQWEKKSSKWAIKSVRRYTNCYKNQKHAEDFFYWDINEAKEKGEAGFLNFWNGEEWQITMYLTMQPCHKSTITEGTKEDQSCCKVMIDAKKHLLGDNVKIVIKPTHLCKAGWEKQNVEKLKEKKKRLKEKKEIELIDKEIKKREDFNTCIDNAEEGVKMLIEEGIELECMKKKDWNFLLQYIQHSKREGEDKKIGKFLKAQAQAHAQAKSLDHLNQLMKSSSVKE